MTTVAVDPSFEKELLGVIPDEDRELLVSKHGITDFSKLMEKKLQIQQRQLEGVCAHAQESLESVCYYLETLDSVSLFKYTEYMKFFGQGNNDTIKENGKEGEDEDRGENEKNDKTNNDPDGYNLTAQEYRRMERQVENDPLTMKIRGFSSRFRSDNDKHTKKKPKILEDGSDKSEVERNGHVYSKKKCFFFEQPNGATVIVGIKSFTKNEKEAICTLVVPYSETIMGSGLEEEPPNGVLPTYKETMDGLSNYVQVKAEFGYEPILPLQELKPCTEPLELPELIYEPQQLGEPPHNFGFVCENDGKNRGQEREEIPFVDLFAGCGGFHQGFERVPWMKGILAVDNWKPACQTFEKNHPDTKILCTNVEDVLDCSPQEFRKTHGKASVLLYTSACQSFSSANRNVDDNGEHDLYRKNLSLKFHNAMKTTNALIGVFENVEGLWRTNNVYFLKKIVQDHIRDGYQVRVRLQHAHTYGDPQERSRMFIYVAKKYVEMPTVLETHGPGKHPYVTVGNALTALEKAQHPDIADDKGSTRTSITVLDKLSWDKPASTIRCGGRVFHPTENRACTVSEVAAFMSFPPDYVFCGSMTDKYKQIGNSVAGRMARAVGQGIAQSLQFMYDEELVEDGKMEADTAAEAASGNETAPVEDVVME